MNERTPDNFVSAPMSGGIDSRRPANGLPPSRSPDLKNVTFEGDSVKKRGGFQSLINDMVPGTGVRNTGYHSKTQLYNPITSTVLNPSLESIHAPGKMLAGHRKGYNDLKNGYVLDFFCSPSDLTTRHVGNGGDEFNTALGYPVNNPFTVTNEGYTIDVRPITGKGPCKFSESRSHLHIDGDFGPRMRHNSTEIRGSIHWNETNYYGKEPTYHDIVAINHAGNVVTALLSTEHGLAVNDPVMLKSTTTVDGQYVVASIVSSFEFTVAHAVATSSATVGTAHTRSPDPEDEKHGCPFAVYLKRKPSTDKFQFAFAFHHITTAGTTFDIHELIDDTTILKVGVKYHVLASFDPGGDVVLRVGRWNDETQAYDYSTTTASGAALTLCNVNQGPVQVFDMPPRLVDAGNATAHPVWQTGTTYWFSAAPGIASTGNSYFMHSIPFEGTVDDFAIWRVGAGTLSVASPSGKDRVLAIDPSSTTHLLSHWDMSLGGERYVRERSGMGNHLYMAPDTAVFDDSSGGEREGKSYFFNGETSYCYAPMAGNPNWSEYDVKDHNDERFYNGSVSSSDRQRKAYGAMEQAVRNSSVTNQGWGLEVVFWPESIEPFEQVLAEIFGTMRISIRTDGHLACYARGPETSGFMAGEDSPWFQVPAVTTLTVEPGQRYHVVGWKTENKTQIYVNGVLAAELTSTSIPIDSAVGTSPIGCLIIGAGSKRLSAWHANTAPPIFRDISAGEPTIDEFNTDARSHFLGRIEHVAALVGSPNSSPLYADQSTLYAKLVTTELWEARTSPDTFNAGSLDPANEGDRTVAIPGGHVAIPTNIGNVGALVDDVSGRDVIPFFAHTEDGGHNFAKGVKVQFVHVLMRWTFAVDDKDRITLGRWDDGRSEIRPSAPTSGGADSLGFFYDAERGSYHYQSAIADDEGRGPALVFRCMVPCRISETNHDAIGLGSTSTTPDHTVPSVHLRNKPYRHVSPREIGPQWTSGLAIPLPGTHPVTSIQDWRHAPTDREVMVVSGQNAFYWARPFWSEDSPYAGEARARCLDSIGGVRGYLRVTGGVSQNSLSGNPVSTVVDLDFWIKPMEVGTGETMLVYHGPGGATAGSANVNYAVFLSQGVLVVAGEGSVRPWAFGQGQFGAAPAAGNETLNASVKAGKWNHLHITMGNLGGAGVSVCAWIDGEPVRLVPWGPRSTWNPGAFSTSNPSGTTNDVYLGGLPSGEDVGLLLNDGATPSPFVMRSFIGKFADFTQRDAVDPGFVPFDAATDNVGSWPRGTVPVARKGDDADTYIHLGLNQTHGRQVDSGAALATAAVGFVEIADIIEIGDGVVGQPGDLFNTAPFRDFIYATNGREVPLEIGLQRQTNRDERNGLTPVLGDRAKAPRRHGFSVHPMGIPLGAAHITGGSTVAQSQKAELIHAPRDLSPSASVAHLAVGEYQWWVSFEDYLGRESDPILLHSQTVTEFLPAQTATSGGPGQLDPYGNGDINIAYVTMATGAPFDFRGVGSSASDFRQAYTVFISGADAPFADGWFVGLAISANTLEIAFDGGVVGLTTMTMTVYYDGIRLNEVPRAEKSSHVVARKFYVSGFGGGNPILHSVVRDNETHSVELAGPGGVLGSSEALVTGFRLPPPRSKLLAVGSGNGAIFLANLPDLPVGENAVAWPDQTEPTYFPLSNTAALDSRDSKAIVGLASSRGTLFIFKRDSTWVMSLGGLNNLTGISASLRVINQSVGLGAGIVHYDDRFYGGSERGIHAFDGANQVYVSKSLEGIWDQPLADSDLLAAQGAFERQDSLYLGSYRSTEGRGNTRVFVLHSNVSNDEGERPFSRWDIPEHVTLKTAVDPLTDRPVVVCGTTSGRVLFYAPDISFDGGVEGQGVVRGTLAASTLGTNTLELQSLEPIQRDLHGTTVSIIYADNTTKLPVQATRTIAHHRRSATTSVIEWVEPLPAHDAAIGITMEIGPIDAYWTTGWIGGKLGDHVKVEEIDIDFEPFAGSKLTVDSLAAKVIRASNTSIKASRTFPTGAESRVVDLDDGFMEHSIGVKEQAAGKYFRVRIGSGPAANSGTQNPFSVFRLGVRFTPTGRRGASR